MPRRIIFDVEYSATISREINCETTEMECEVESFDEWKAETDDVPENGRTPKEIREEYREYLEDTAMEHAGNAIQEYIAQNDINDWEESIESCECDTVSLEDNPFTDDPKPKAKADEEKTDG